MREQPPVWLVRGAELGEERELLNRNFLVSVQAGEGLEAGGATTSKWYFSSATILSNFRKMKQQPEKNYIFLSGLVSAITHTCAK